MSSHIVCEPCVGRGTPPSVRPFFFEATLIPLGKKAGGRLSWNPLVTLIHKPISWQWPPRSQKRGSMLYQLPLWAYDWMRWSELQWVCTWACLSVGPTNASTVRRKRTTRTLMVLDVVSARDTTHIMVL